MSPVRRSRGSDLADHGSEPLSLARRAITFLMLGARAVAVILAITAAPGENTFAAERYRERAERDPSVRAAAMVRRAAILAGPLAHPDGATRELEGLRTAHAERLSPSDDILIGTTPAHFYEHRLDQPGLAMRELRRLLDTYPDAPPTDSLRRSLRALKDAEPSAPADRPTP